MKKNVLSAATCLSLMTLGAQAGPVEFKNIYSLGDSLSDVGVYSNAVIGGAALQGVTLPNIQYRSPTTIPMAAVRYGLKI